VLAGCNTCVKVQQVSQVLASNKFKFISLFIVKYTQIIWFNN